MIELYSAPRTRALRVAWLLEELAQPYTLHQVEFKPTSSQFFIQDTPTGKIPTLVDGDVVMAESGAILQYILQQYPDNPFQPQTSDAAYADFLQWFHFSESTAFAPMGVVVWLTLYRQDAAAHPELVNDARQRALASLQPIEQRLQHSDYLAGSSFSAADIMMGFTLLAATLLELTQETPAIQDYLSRLTARPAFARAAEKVGGYELPAP
ncbi:MAG: glutathione S-transferase family protein [Pseudomonadota bacterium]